MVLSVLGGLASAAGGLFGANAAADAAREATRLQRQQFKYQKSLAEPLYERGQGANALLDAVYGVGYGGNTQALGEDRQNFMQDFESSPVYQAYYQSALDNANDRIMAGATARGVSNSGATLKALQDRAGEIGGNTLSKYLAGIQDASTQGSNALSALTGASQNFGNRAADLAQDQGAANAAGYLGIGNTINNTLADIVQMNALGNGNSARGSSGFGPTNIVPNSYYDY